MRSTFDKILFDAAVERGAIWIKATAVAPVVEKDAVVGLTIRTPDGATEKLYSEVLVDASGCATFLANHRVTGRKMPGASDKQIALFTQFANTIRDTAGTLATAGQHAALLSGETLLGLVHPGKRRADQRRHCSSAPNISRRPAYRRSRLCCTNAGI